MTAFKRHATVPPARDGQRLDLYLLRAFPELTRRAVVAHIGNGRVTLDGKTVTRVEQRVVRGLRVALLPLTSEKRVALMSGDLVHDDARVIGIAKPPGLPSHRTPTGEEGAAEAAATLFANGRGLYVVHRLDRATSGVMLLARDPTTANDIALQLRRRTVTKAYRALVDGRVRDDHGHIRAPLREVPSTHRGQTFVTPTGRPAETAYRVLERRAETTLVALQPESGRRHQLRVHFAHIGRPIVGDLTYGGSEAARMWLHAESIELVLDGGRVAVQAPPPVELCER